MFPTELLWPSTIVLGLLFGSFLNVLIYRLPRGISPLAGRSKCPACKAQIAWYDNVPLFAYILWLRGKCRRCHTRLSALYPTVELLSALIAVFCVYQFGATLKAMWVYGFLASLMVITIIDWQHQIIPDSLSLGGIVYGWVGSLVCLDITLIESIAGALFGGGVVLAVALLYRVIRKVDGMGGGDVKLMAMIGAFVGWKMIFPVLFIASLFGSIWGIYLMRRGGGSSKTAVAFGSFLAPAATVIFLFGAQLWQAYMGL